jgi:5-methylcytosine-specific restriction endonuclease McrA
MICAQPGCPTIATHRGRCPQHQPPPSPSHTRRIRGQTRARILTPDATCHWCHAPATQVDHLTPVAHDGTSDPANLVPSCTRCNTSRGARLTHPQ